MCWQLYLYINGIIEIHWSQVTDYSISDFQGNTLYLPFTPLLCVTLSIVSILYCITNFNVSRIHVGVLKSWKCFWRAIPIYLDFLPFFITGTFFRIMSVIVIMTYFGFYFGLIPVVVAILISTIIINQFTFR